MTSRETFNDKPIYSLSEISKSLQSVIAKTYNRPYYIKAEIVKLNYYPRTGHCYPELVEKEDQKIKAQIRAIIWSAQFHTINERFKKITGEEIKEGLNILCLATIEYHPLYGLSLYIQDIEPSFTLGELTKNKIQVIERLKKEGVFTANKLKFLPLLPKRIAVISVETSKGYSDFMITLQQNSWNYKFACQLFPAVLQGEKAITTITEQLNNIEKQLGKFDCVAIIRGGGGDVGFSCYDQYELASKVATFPIPVISGIGHSTNETVTEMVSYENKITPTEVAYFFIQKFHDFMIQIQDYQDYIINFVCNTIKEEKLKIEQLENERKHIATKLISVAKQAVAKIGADYLHYAAKMLANEKQKIEGQLQLLQLLTRQGINKQKDIINNLDSQIKLLHPDNVLKRGFSITYFEGKIVTNTSKLKQDDKIITKMFKGEVESRVTKI